MRRWEEAKCKTKAGPDVRGFANNVKKNFTLIYLHLKAIEGFYARSLSVVKFTKLRSAS
jgi:hypothetical protein